MPFNIQEDFENIESNPKFADDLLDGDIELIKDMPLTPEMMHQAESLMGAQGSKYGIGPEEIEMLSQIPNAASMNATIGQIVQRPALGTGAGGYQFNRQQQPTSFEDIEASLQRKASSSKAAVVAPAVTPNDSESGAPGMGVEGGPGEIGTDTTDMSPNQIAAAKGAFVNAATGLIPDLDLNTIMSIPGFFTALANDPTATLSVALKGLMAPLALTQFVYNFTMGYSESLDSLEASDLARGYPEISQAEITSQDPDSFVQTNPDPTTMSQDDIAMAPAPPSVDIAPTVSQEEIEGHAKGGTPDPDLGAIGGGTGTVGGLDGDNGDSDGMGSASGEAGCFIAGTKIKTLRGTKSIEDIRKGDIVMSFPDDNVRLLELQPKKVIKIKMHTNIQTININGLVLTTPEHKFVTTKGWKPAGQLKTGDTLIGVNGNPILVKKLFDGPKATVYNFEVVDNHTYIANGFRVSNWKHTGNIIKAIPESGLMKGHEVQFRALIGEGVLPINVIDGLGEVVFEAIRKGKVGVNKIKKFVEKEMSKPGE